MGLFSKGQSSLSPAQQQLMQIAGEKQAHFRKTWLPVQQYFAQQTLQNQPGLAAMEQGKAASTARTQGTEATQKLAERTTAQAGLGSGRSVLGLGAGSTATGAGAGLAQTAGDLQARQAYEQGLAKVLSLGQQDENTATQGLQTAGGNQQALAQQTTQQNLAEQQGFGQLLGLGGALGGAAVRGYQSPAPQGGLASWGSSNAAYPGSNDWSAG